MNLTKQLSNHFNMINSRLKTFSGIIQSLLLTRDCHYKDFAEYIPNHTSFDTKIKSVARFLLNNPIKNDDYYHFMKHYIPTNKYIISIDRTIWEFGKQIRNILVLAVSYKGISLPVIFEVIPYRGACTAEDQIKIVSKFISLYGKDNIEAITADREFDNIKFINYLASTGVNYAIRLRKISRVTDVKGHQVRLEHLKQKALLNHETIFYGHSSILNHVSLKRGKYLSVISGKPCDGLGLYKRRWDIELAFKGCKSSGFKMENCKLRNPLRLLTFIKCIFIAFALALKTGERGDRVKSIKTKFSIGYKAYSLLQYGLQIIKEAFAKQSKKLIKIILYEALPKKHNKIFVR